MITFKELLERAKGEMFAIHTPTEEQAKVLSSELDKNGFKWYNGYKLTTGTNYQTYKENTCYNFEKDNRVCYSPLVWYQKHGYTIIEFIDIDFSEKTN